MLPPHDQSSSRQETREPASPPAYWPTWALLTLFIFIGFECTLLAFALKGSWLILLAPGAVCAMKAWHTWETLKRHTGEG